MKIKNDYIEIVDKYLSVFLKEEEDYLDFWVGDELGGIACINYDLFIDFDTIRYCVDNGITIDKFREYQEYVLEKYFRDPEKEYRDYIKEKYFDGSFPNFKNWIKGVK